MGVLAALSLRVQGRRGQLNETATTTMEQFDISKMISEVEAYVGLPAGTIRPFFSEADHWVFVLKISSILETVLKSAIIARIDQSGPRFYGGLGALLLSGEVDEPWRSLIYRLPLSGDIGAIPLAKRYRLLDPPDEAFIREVLAIRNRYAHSITNHSKTALQIVSENKKIKIRSTRCAGGCTIPKNFMEWCTNQRSLTNGVRHSLVCLAGFGLRRARPVAYSLN